jgi:hypothetical protein
MRPHRSVSTKVASSPARHHHPSRPPAQRTRESQHPLAQSDDRNMTVIATWVQVFRHCRPSRRPAMVVVSFPGGCCVRIRSE